MANRIKRLGERERDRAEQILLRLTHLPDPPGAVYFNIYMLHVETGEFVKSTHWAKKARLAFHETQPSTFSGIMAGNYERLGLTGDSDYWMADAMTHMPQPENKFFFKAWQLRIRGDLAGIRAEIGKLRTALDTDIDGLPGNYAAMYAVANIYVASFDVGIDVFESAFDFESLSIDKLRTLIALETWHALAYAYQQVGRNDEANVLLARLHERLNAYIVESKMDFGPLHHVRAQNFGLRGDFDAAANALEAAIKAGWLRYNWVMHDPTWAKTIAHPRIARMLDEVKVELERQRALVEQADAEHDFRAEVEALRSAPGD